MDRSIQRPIDERVKNVLKFVQKSISPHFPGAGVDNLLSNDSRDHYLINDNFDVLLIDDGPGP